MHEGMSSRALVLGLVLLAAGCAGNDYGPSGQPPPPIIPDSGWTPPDAGPGTPDAGRPDAGQPDAGPPPFIDAGTRDAGVIVVGEWNIQFFGKSDAGPNDDALQAANVTTVMGYENADIWTLEEVCDDQVDYLDQVISTLRTQYGEDYDYVLANDPTIGHAYSGYGGNWGQKTAVLWKKSVATKVGAQLLYDTSIDPSWGSNFATRDPLEVHLTLNTPSGPQDIYVIAVHLKSGASSSDYSERQTEAADLKAYLDQNRAGVPVFVSGDWNDDLDASIYQSSQTPFQNFLNDSANYKFPSADYDTQRTEISYTSAIDHHLISNELFGNYVAGSAHVGRPDQGTNSPLISGYNTDNTSDHYPTFATYEFP
jgi:endonuclease/exonuclease/phosphatase family metal-dependent hydrolase